MIRYTRLFALLATVIAFSGAAAQTGIGADILKRMLPMLASLAMGALAQRARRSSAGNIQLDSSPSGGGLMDMLGPLLGGRGGGGGVGDLLGGLFRR